MSTPTAFPGVSLAIPQPVVRDLPLPRLPRTPSWKPGNSPQWVLVLVPTRTSARDTEGVLLSSTVRPVFAMPLTRRQQKEVKQVGYWVRRLKKAETGRDALNEMWSWLLGALTELDKRQGRAADAARYHLARELADFAVKLPEAEIPFRAGLTGDEERHLFDPWDRHGESR